MLKPRPRLGFVGLGWIGRARLAALAEYDIADVCGVADPTPEARRAAREFAPSARECAGMEELLRMDLDGLVIATPSAQHAGEALQALERGVAVFCQKPLGRDALETARVVAQARRADRPLGVDFCYRKTRALRHVKDLVESGALGRILGARFVFHNAYGPDKPWYYERAASGGGCVMDLGIHLVDAALWMFEYPGVEAVRSRLFAKGQALCGQEVEDYATAHLQLAAGCEVEVACSWNLSAGRDAVIEVELHGSEGGAKFSNVNGSFYDFRAELYRGTKTTVLCEPPDAWGGRTLADWALALTRGDGFDAHAEHLVDVARVLDRIYAGASTPLSPQAGPSL